MMKITYTCDCCKLLIEGAPFRVEVRDKELHIDKACAETLTLVQIIDKVWPTNTGDKIT